jgi:hypothetical protein
MSSTNDGLPLNNHSGNVYDSLFADRIDALGKSSSGSPAPNPKGGNENGAGWPVAATVFIILVIVRGCTSLSSSSSSSSYRNYKVNTPSSEELMRKFEQDRGEAFRRQQELLRQLQERRPLVNPDNPEGDIPPREVPEEVKRGREQELFDKEVVLPIRGRNAAEEFRKLREQLKRATQQQPALPAAPDKPDRGP